MMRIIIILLLFNVLISSAQVLQNNSAYKNAFEFLCLEKEAMIKEFFHDRLSHSEGVKANRLLKRVFCNSLINSTHKENLCLKLSKERYLFPSLLLLD